MTINDRLASLRARYEALRVEQLLISNMSRKIVLSHTLQALDEEIIALKHPEFLEIKESANVH